MKLQTAIRIFALMAAILLLMPFARVSAFQYNFLNNSEVLDFTSSLLRREGINVTNIDSWLALVRQYNDRVRFFSASGSGWRECDNPDELDSSSLIGSRNVNCRISVFSLLRDEISVDNDVRCSIEERHFDGEIERMNAMLPEPLTHSEEETYGVLFDPVKLPSDMPPGDAFDETLDVYRTYWEKEGLRFPDNPDLKVMQVIVIDPAGGVAYSDHTGLIVDRGSKLYLIEKISPVSPFAVSVFTNYGSMGEYLCEDFDSRSGNDVMILANDDMVWNNRL